LIRWLFQTNEQMIIEMEEFDIDDGIADEIYASDEDFVESVKIHNVYYIGIVKYTRNEGTFIMANVISPKIFFKYSIDDVIDYLQEYCCMEYRSPPKPNIMKLFISDAGTYEVIIKTHWIRLIQRHWKKIFAQRQRVIQKMRHPHFLRIRETTGRFPFTIPSIHGLLSDYTE